MTGHVFVVDDDLAVLDALSARLRLEGIGTVCWHRPDRFLAEARLAAADCLLLDVRMPGADGIAVLADVQARRPALPVIMMTGHGDVELAVQAMKAGAADFIEKPFSDDRVLEAVAAAVTIASERRSREREMATAQAVLAKLSSREQEVLARMLKGRPSKAIAAEIGCSPRTVEVHRAHIMKKTCAASVAELVTLAIAAGFREPPVANT
jgi:two-component system, LuxR family, response regulator FixJ